MGLIEPVAPTRIYIQLGVKIFFPSFVAQFYFYLLSSINSIKRNVMSTPLFSLYVLLAPDNSF